MAEKKQRFVSQFVAFVSKSADDPLSRKLGKVGADIEAHIFSYLRLDDVGALFATHRAAQQRFVPVLASDGHVTFVMHRVIGAPGSGCKACSALRPVDSSTSGFIYPSDTTTNSDVNQYKNPMGYRNNLAALIH